MVLDRSNRGIHEPPSKRSLQLTPNQQLTHLGDTKKEHAQSQDKVDDDHHPSGRAQGVDFFEPHGRQGNDSHVQGVEKGPALDNHESERSRCWKEEKQQNQSDRSGHTESGSKSFSPRSHAQRGEDLGSLVEYSKVLGRQSSFFGECRIRLGRATSACLPTGGSSRETVQAGLLTLATSRWRARSADSSDSPRGRPPENRDVTITGHYAIGLCDDTPQSPSPGWLRASSASSRTQQNLRSPSRHCGRFRHSRAQSPRSRS